MAMTAASILICVIVLNLHHRDTITSIPPWLKYITFRLMAPVVCMRTHVDTHTGESSEQVPIYNDPHVKVQKSSSFRSSDVRKPSFRRSRKNTIAESDLRYASMYGDNIYGTTGVGGNLCNNHFDHTGKVNAKKKELIAEILEHIRHITNKMRESEEEDTLKTDWKLVAKILDRFFLFVFIACTVISSSVLLVVYPLFSSIPY